ncbi:MAG: hypothetical protein Q8L87_12970 [Anaerolineales bacterium]|jgi:hypothetical protein|nr:hypothetical protein [Anaerolineales bacterium]
MKNFNLGEVLTRAWNIIWKHKILWVFGIFAVFARGGGGSGGGGNSGYRYDSSDAPFPTDQFERGFEQFGQFMEQNLWIIFALIAFIFVLSFLFYALGIMGRIGLIQGALKVEKGAESLTFAELWSESMPYFWRIFGLNFLIGLAVFVLIVPLVLFGVITAGVGFLCILPLICILVPISWVVMVIVEQAQPAIIAENLGMWDGFKRGWEIVKANAVNFIILALILMVGGAIVGFIIAIPIIFAVVPLVLGANILDQTLTPIYIALACCAVYLPVLYLLNGILAAYIQSVWTLTYLRLTKPSEEAPVFAEENA